MERGRQRILEPWLGGLAVMPIFIATACGRGQLEPALHWRTTPELIHVGIPFPSWCIYAYLYQVVWEEESSRCFLSGSSPSQVWWGLETESGGGRSGRNFSQLLFVEMEVPSASQIKGSQKSGLFFFFFETKRGEISRFLNISRIGAFLTRLCRRKHQEEPVACRFLQQTVILQAMHREAPLLESCDNSY